MGVGRSLRRIKAMGRRGGERGRGGEDKEGRWDREGEEKGGDGWQFKTFALGNSSGSRYHISISTLLLNS